MGFNGHLQLSFSRGMVYATFYNPDYVGLYASLIVPILMSAVQVMNRKIWKALALIDVVMMLICVIGATAASGIIAMWLAIIIYITLHIISIRHKKTKVLLSIGALILLIGLSVGIAYTSTYLREHILVENTSIDTDQQPTSDADLDSDQALAAEIPADHSTLLNSIIETDKYVEFNYNGYLLRENIYIENGVALINFVDENGNQIKYTYDATSGVYSIEDPRFNTITSVTCSIDDQFIGFVTTIDGKEWTFAYGMGSEGNVTYYYYTDWSKMDKSIASESLFVPESKWGILNGRGFLWAKTLGLLKHHLILGTGADSFTLVFPHSDYVAMYKSGYEDMIVTKPHNLYLQCATQSGVLALICLLLFYVLFFIRNGKRMLANQATNSSVSLMRNAFFAGTIGFLVCGLANDSTICVTPIFCIVMGLALGLEKIDVANKQ